MQEKYNIDEEFMNQAWGEMETLLDKEMPVQKRKRRLAFWWLWGGITASTALAFIYFNFTPLENSSKKIFPKKILKEQELNTATNDKIAILETATKQIETLEKEKTPSLATKTPSSKSTGIASKDIVIANAVSSTKSIPNSPNLPQKGMENTPQKHAISIADIEEMQAKEAKDLTVTIEMESTSATSTKSKKIVDYVDVLLSGNLPQLSHSSNVELLAIKEISRPKKHQWRHGISLGWQQYFDSKFDGQIAYLAHFQQQRWQISSGVGLSFPASLDFANDDLLADAISFDEPDIDSSVTTTSEAEDMDTTSTVGESDFEFMDKSIATNTNGLVIPLFIRYKLNKFSVFVEGQAFYHLNSNQDSNFDAATGRTNMNNQEETTKPWNYQLGAGMGYQLGRNWSLDVSYQHRFRTSENAVLLGVHYYFK